MQLVLFLVLGVLQFGWILWPALGLYVGMASFIAVVGIVLIGWCCRFRGF